MTEASLSDIPDTADDRRAKRNVAVLVMAQAILGSQMPMIFVIGGLAGLMIAPSPALATIPISLIVFGSMTTAPWLSAVMQRFGRRAGFFIGCLGGALGGAVSAWGLWIDHFPIFLAAPTSPASTCPRRASTASPPPTARPRCVPAQGDFLRHGRRAPLGADRAAAGQGHDRRDGGTLRRHLPRGGRINLVGAALFLALDLPKPAPPRADAPAGRTRLELLKDPKIAVAIICGMVSYALMNLMMTSTPLAMVGCGYTTGTAADVVSAHVIAMFAPSFVTGHLIARFGTMRIVGTGLFLLALAGVVALTGVELYQFFGALVLLGIGWNFGFIGATALLTQSHTPEERGRVQGMNDFFVFGCVTVASLASGFLMSSGADVVSGWNAVNIAMVPFLALAGAALIWLALRPRDEALT
jgi:MFS family permease